MVLIAVSPLTPELSKALAKKHDLDFEVLSDKGNKVAHDYGLVFTLPEELQPIYTGFGINIPLSNGDNTYELPLPATYIIDRKGTIRLASIDADYTVRLDPEEIVTFLQKNTF